MNCEKCNGPMWDNRNDKRNPKSPDFKCKDKGCGHAVWLKPKNGNQAPRVEAGPGAPRTPKWTWSSLNLTYARSLAIAEKQVTALAVKHKVAFRIEDVLAACATLFICATRDGVEEPKPKPVPVPMNADAEPENDESSDLPF